MKKIDKYLLTHFPILWNTKAHWMLPLLLILHLGYYLIGYFQKIDFVNIRYSLGSPDESAVAFTILLSLALLIIWLIYYFRNNALKNIYPVSWISQVMEYAIVLIISFLLCTFLRSYREGCLQHYRSYVKERKVNLADEINTVNIAEAFLPTTFDAYHYSRNCSSDGQTESAQYDSAYAMNGKSSNSSEAFSYLNYCDLTIQTSLTTASQNEIYSREEVHAVVNRWLQENQRDSVKLVINKYLDLIKKYGGTYEFNVDAHVTNIFSTKNFVVTRTIQAYNDSGNDKEFINRYNAISSINAQNETNVRDRDDDLVFFYFYFSFAIAILITSFRWFRLRTWVVSLIGAAVWGIIFVLIGIASRDGDTAILFYIALALLFLLIGGGMIISKINKPYSGVLLTWFYWPLPSLWPCIRLLDEWHRRYYQYNDDGWNIFHYWNYILIFIITILVIIPLAKRWQANPEQ